VKCFCLAVGVGKTLYYKSWSPLF